MLEGVEECTFFSHKLMVEVQSREKKKVRENLECNGMYIGSEDTFTNNSLIYSLLVVIIFPFFACNQRMIFAFFFYRVICATFFSFLSHCSVVMTSVTVGSRWAARS